jgi:large subunit ribosomal protein L21
MSEKAVISTGGKQYIVSKGDEIEVELIGGDKETLSFEPLLIIDSGKTKVGTPSVKGAKVTVKVGEQIKGDKTTSIRYKAKKRVRKVKGHRQRYSKIKITAIDS